jgi:hypothetical protein
VVSVDFLMIAAEVEVGREQGKRGERSRRGGDGVVFCFLVDSMDFYGGGTAGSHKRTETLMAFSVRKSSCRA